MYAFFNIEEPIFFILALIAIIGFCISVFTNSIYLIIQIIIKKKIHPSFKKENMLSYIIALTVAVISLGLLLNIYRPGLLGWFAPRIIDFGFIILITLTLIFKIIKEPRRDERMVLLSWKAIKFTMILVVVEILIIIYIDTMYHIDVQISMFLIYFLINILAIYRMLYMLFVKLY